MKRSGIDTFYDEFGSFSLNDEVYPFINQIGTVNAVFPLLTPTFKERTENRVGWIFDEIQCFTARRARNPTGCHPIFLAGTKETSCTFSAFTARKFLLLYNGYKHRSP